MNIREYLTEIADAIRENDGTTELIPALDFPQRIREGGARLTVGERMTPNEAITTTYTVRNTYKKCIIAFSSARNYDSTNALVLKKNGVNIPVLFTQDYRYGASVNVSAFHGMSEVISLNVGDVITYSYNNRNTAQNSIVIINI